MPRPRRKTSLIYWKRGRAYADFTGPEYAPWGGKLTALKPDGERTATSDPELANILLAQHMQRFRELRETYPNGFAPAGEDPLDRIAPFAGHHVASLRGTMRKGRALSDKTVRAQQAALTHAARFLAARTDAKRPQGIRYLREIAAADVSAWLKHIADSPPAPLAPRRGGRLARSGGTYGKYLAALRRMLERAWREDRIPHNPVHKLPPEDRPSAGESPTHHLEIPEAALALEAARLSAAAASRHQARATENYVRMAAYLLTGGSGNDVEGLEKADLDWRNERVWFRDNETRQGIMKGRGRRSVPFFPQLQEIVREYLAGPHCPPGKRLFRGGDMGRWLDGVARSVGMPRGYLSVRVFRVTYASARLQTTDGGRPIAERTVLAELGHRSSKMLNDVYAHVGAFRSRGEHVAYVWHEHEAEMGHRIHGVERLTPSAARALASLPARGGLTAGAWQASCGLAAGTFCYVRDRLVARGFVVAEGAGRSPLYYLTGAGAAVLAARDAGAADAAAGG